MGSMLGLLLLLAVQHKNLIMFADYTKSLLLKKLLTRKIIGK